MLRKLFQPRKTVEPQAPVLNLALRSGEVSVLVRRNPRARRMTLRVRAATRDVVLTLPARVALAAARDFLDRHTGWVEARLGRLPQAVAFVPGAVLPVRGEPHLVEHRPGRGVSRIEPGAPARLVVHGAAEHVARRITALLKDEALADLKAATARHAARLGVTVSRVQIKDTRSRWGSCSATGAIAFSWRLILAPPHVLDYLAAHEVAHRREMNHGPAFWRIVRELDPGMDAAEAWLRANGPALHRYGQA